MKMLLQSPKHLLWVVFLITSVCTSSAQSYESYRFAFYAGDDMFYATTENSAELRRLVDAVANVRELINDGQATIHVDGYSAASLNEATMRANRVKSEIIVRNGVTEQCFLTRTHLQGDSVVVVLQLPPRRPGPPPPVVHPKSVPRDETEEMPAPTVDEGVAYIQDDTVAFVDHCDKALTE